VTRLLFQMVQENVLAPSIQGSLLIKLLLNEVAGVRDWMEGVIQDEHGSDRGMTFSRALLEPGQDKAWPVLWPIIQADANFGRALLERFSYAHPDRSSFGAGFTETELEDLYVWLAEQYPPTNDRRASGAIGPNRYHSTTS
jgi:hypothetical protein